MSSYILATGTSVPPHTMTQCAALEVFQDLTCPDDRRRRLAKVMFDRAKIENRFTVVPIEAFYQWLADQKTPAQQIKLGGPLTSAPDPLPEITPGASRGLSTEQRMRLYDLFAADLAIESARQAIEFSNRPPSEITHLVTVSCTGFAAPGVDVRLIKSLGLPPSTQRTHTGFMGCHGAVNGIRTAMNITNANPEANVLMCCVELCSLHGQFQWDEGDNNKIIGNALFGDGSASLVVSGNGHNENGNWEIVDTGSVLIEDSEAELCWSIGDHGFEMILNSDIGDHIESALADWLSQWLGTRGLDFSQIDCWAVHPGGPKIIKSVQQSLDLSDQQLSTSLDVLRRYGNMSSPTVLFILEEFKKAMAATAASAQPKHAIIIAFGPGLVAEVGLLRNNG